MGGRDLGMRDFSVTADLAGLDLAVADLAHADLARVIPDGGFTVPSLILAGIGTGGGLATAGYDSAGGWSGYTVDSTVMLTDVSASISGGVALVAMRLSDTHLNVSTWDKQTGAFTVPAEPFATAFTAHRPTLNGPEMLFQGGISADQHLYASHWNGTQFNTAAQQSTFLTDLAPVVLAGATVHAVFTGTDKKIYDGTVGSVAVEAGGGTSNVSPTATVLQGGTILVVFAGEDTNLYWSALSGASYTAPKSLCAGLTGCLVDTDLSPSLVTAGNGAVVVYRGKNKKIYSAKFLPNATLSASTFDVAIPASGTETTNFMPAVATGLGVDAEVVWVRDSDGAGRHARLSAGAWSTAVTVPNSNFTGPVSLGR